MLDLTASLPSLCDESKQAFGKRRSSHDVGTMWELWELPRRSLWEHRGNWRPGMTIKKLRKNDDHHGALPRTMGNDPHAPDPIPGPKTQGKLVKWHGRSGYKKNDTPPRWLGDKTVARCAKGSSRCTSSFNRCHHHRPSFVIVHRNHRRQSSTGHDRLCQAATASSSLVADPQWRRSAVIVQPGSA